MFSMLVWALIMAGAIFILLKVWSLIHKASLWKWHDSFWSNNNTRLYTFWIVLIVWLLFNFAFFDIGPQPEAPYGETAQKYYNLLRLGKFVTDSVLNGPMITVMDRVKEFLGTGAWRDWWIWLFCCTIYVPIAFRDELFRAIGMVYGLTLGKRNRGGEEKKETEAKNEPRNEPRSETEPQSKSMSWIREIWKEFVAEYAVDFTKRFGKGR